MPDPKDIPPELVAAAEALARKLSSDFVVDIVDEDEEDADEREGALTEAIARFAAEAVRRERERLRATGVRLCVRCGSLLGPPPGIHTCIRDESEGA